MPPKTTAAARRRGIMAAAVTVTAALLAALAGCGVIGDDYVYVEWYSWYFEKYFPRWFDEFERRHAGENVRVKFRAMSGSTAQMVYTMLLSHTLSDCITVGSQTNAILLENPVLEPIAPGDIDFDDVPPLAVELATAKDGRIVGIPFGLGMRPFVYFNREALREAGTSEREVPETFDEYRAWAAGLFKWRMDGRIVYGPLDDEELERAAMLRRPFAMMRGFLWSATPILISRVDPLPDANGKSDHSLDDFIGGPPSGRPFRLNTPEVIEGLREYRKFYLPKKTAVVDGDQTRVPAFIKGLYAGVEGSNWIYGEVYTVDMQVTRMPHAPGEPARIHMNSSSIGISRESVHKQLALDFAKFITSTEAQVDAYYGHGYLPSNYSAWRRLEADAAVDDAVREKFLSPAQFKSAGYIAVPQVKRRDHDTMEVYLYVPYPKDACVLTASCKAAGRGAEEVAATEHIAAQAAPHKTRAERLARDIAAFSSLNVDVIIQGTPEEMIPSRSFVTPSPVPVYAGLLDSGFYVPIDKIWDRLAGEVITRVCQFVTRADDPMEPEEAAEWAQKEAEDIFAGRK